MSILAVRISLLPYTHKKGEQKVHIHVQFIYLWLAADNGVISRLEGVADLREALVLHLEHDVGAGRAVVVEIVVVDQELLRVVDVAHYRARLHDPPTRRLRRSYPLSSAAAAAAAVVAAPSPSLSPLKTTTMTCWSAKETPHHRAEYQIAACASVAAPLVILSRVAGSCSTTRALPR